MNKKQFFLTVTCSVFIGILNGLFGGGGGMLCVPALTKIFNLDPKSAHATAIFIMLPISIASVIIYATNINFNLVKNLWLIVGVVLGGLVGAKLLNNTKNDTLTIIFACVMLFAGVRLLF